MYTMTTNLNYTKNQHTNTKAFARARAAAEYAQRASRSQVGTSQPLVHRVHRLAHRRRRLRQCQRVPQDEEGVRHAVLEHVRGHAGGAQYGGVLPPLVDERVHLGEDHGGGGEAGVAVGRCERAGPRVLLACLARGLVVARRLIVAKVRRGEEVESARPDEHSRLVQPPPGFGGAARRDRDRVHQQLVTHR
eukprot:scaffold99452_cov67-Phaeocystis_antarctica.AAC.1